MGSDRNDKGTGQGVVEQVFVSENIWRALILISTAAVLLFSVYCLSHGITTVFMHLYYFPIVLLAYRYRYRGFVLATLLSIAYVMLVYIYDFGQPDIIAGAWYRLIVFVGIAAIVAYLSEQLALAPMFQKESANTIKKMYHALLSENVWRALILVSSAAVILFSIYCLSQGITIIFMHLYYFPIVLLAYRYRYRGLVLSTLLSLVYVGLVVYFHPEQDEVIGALCRFAVFVGIAAVVAYLSERLAVVHLSQKERLETIQNLQQFQESVIANAHIWITVLDPDGTIIVWNTAAETISGYKQGEVQGKRTIWGNLYPDKAYRQKVTREIHRIIKQETYLENFETEIRCADGTQKTIVWNTRGIRNEDGSIRSYIAIGRDITEHKKVEGALQLTNAILTSQTEAAIDGILVVDEAGKIISYNHRFIEIWEIPPDVIASRSDERALQSVLDKLVDPEEFLARVRYLYTHREEKSKEEIRLNDERILDRYSAPMIGSDGRYYGRVWYFHDISDRKKAEQEIARTAREWETTFNATSDGICLIDADQNLIRCNNRMGEILGGMKQEDLAGKPCWAVVHKTTGPIPECPFVSAKKTLKRTRIEIPAGDLWFEVTADPIFNSSGTFTGAVHIMRDITERKHAEAALLESEEKYRMLFENMQDGFAYCRMIFDSAGHPEDFIYLNVNSAFDRITGTKTVTMKRVT
ncbi:MAG: PAS domain S-box protein, partial [Methanoregula sp.]|nr:PAS domain S-box protein [Methanoregula sp.]